MKNKIWMIGVALILILPILGFKDLGFKDKENIDQGRVIQFDNAKGIIKVILNKNADHLNSDYSSLPPVTYSLPADPQAIGDIPKAGLRMKLDPKNNEIVIFDDANQEFKTLTYALIDQKDNIAKDNPLVLENGNPQKFPVIDRKKNLITVYSERQRVLTTFLLPSKYLSLPEYAWGAGDEVLIHYKEDGKTRWVTKIAKIGFVNGK